MSRYAVVVVGIAAVLLTGAIPGVDGCALAAAPDHTCCAEPAPEPTSSCCSSMEASGSRTETEHQTGCDCVHPPSTPADVVASTAPTVPDDDASVDLKSEDRFFTISLQRRARAIEHRVRSHPPPPVFLLDCSFLI